MALNSDSRNSAFSFKFFKLFSSLFLFWKKRGKVFLLRNSIVEENIKWTGFSNFDSKFGDVTRFYWKNTIPIDKFTRFWGEFLLNLIHIIPIFSISYICRPTVKILWLNLNKWRKWQQIGESSGRPVWIWLQVPWVTTSTDINWLTHFNWKKINFYQVVLPMYLLDNLWTRSKWKCRPFPVCYHSFVFFHFCFFSINF